jgi:hypothetical protein
MILDILKIERGRGGRLLKDKLGNGNARAGPKRAEK